MIPKRIRSKYQPISTRESADACFTTDVGQSLEKLTIKGYKKT